MAVARGGLLRAPVVALTVLALLGTGRTAGAADPDSGAILPALFPGSAAGLKDTPPFFRDTHFLFHFRTFYFNNEASPDTFQEAWAAGGRLIYQSGWLSDIFSIGAAGYFSLPVYAPDDRDGTPRPKPGQDPIVVLGEAWAKLQYGEHVLTGYRQRINVGYVNDQDIRMLPHTFEAIMMDGKVGWLDYHAGYLFTIKPREQDHFISMADRVGAVDSDAGLVLGGVRITPWQPLTVEASDAYRVDTFNTALIQAE